MNRNVVANRREALGFASIAVAAAAVGAPAIAAAAPAPPSTRPTDEALARVVRLYAGEFGGSRGVR